MLTACLLEIFLGESSSEGERSLLSVLSAAGAILTEIEASMRTRLKLNCERGTATNSSQASLGRERERDEYI